MSKEPKVDKARLREELSIRPLGEPPLPGLPPVPKAAPFRPAPQVVGSPLLQLLVNRVLQDAPELRGRVPRIVGGPTKGSMLYMDYLGQPIELPPYASRLAGVMEDSTREIGINPDIRSEGELLKTLIHELLHSVGHDDENTVETKTNAILGLPPLTERFKALTSKEKK